VAAARLFGLRPTWRTTPRQTERDAHSTNAKIRPRRLGSKERPCDMKADNIELAKTPFWNSFQVGQEINSKMIEFAGANVSAALNFVVKLSGVRSPVDFTDVVASHTRDNFKLLTDEIEQISSLIRTSGEKSPDRPLGS
jgi:hypothetical protein